MVSLSVVQVQMLINIFVFTAFGYLVIWYDDDDDDVDDEYDDDDDDDGR